MHRAQCVLPNHAVDRTPEAPRRRLSCLRKAATAHGLPSKANRERHGQAVRVGEVGALDHQEHPGPVRRVAAALQRLTGNPSPLVSGAPWERYAIRCEALSPDAMAVERLVREKGLFSFYQDGHQECCGIRKVRPLRRRLQSLDAWVTGQRKDQSLATRHHRGSRARCGVLDARACPGQVQPARELDRRRGLGLHP